MKQQARGYRGGGGGWVRIGSGGEGGGVRIGSGRRGTHTEGPRISGNHDPATYTFDFANARRRPWRRKHPRAANS